jgi:hypothetical protein
VHRPSTRLSAGLAAAALTALTAVSASAADPVGAAATETLFISAGCPQDTPGTCTSTRWLGKQTGSATSNFLTATTPVDEVLFQSDGTVNWRDYASDKSLRTGGYPLRADAPLTMAVTVTANALAVNSTVHGRLSGRIVDAVTGQATTVALGEAKQVITLVADKKTVTFEFDLPDSLEGDTLTSVLAEVAVHGVNAQGGYIDQQGGSTVSIPYYEPAA